LFDRGNKKLKVDLGEMKNEFKILSDFLLSRLKDGVTLNKKKIIVASKYSSPDELKRLVNKFIYHKNLHHKFFVSLDGDIVRINKFKSSNKKKKENHATVPSTIKHGW
jgi:hypothetical protein